MSWIQEECYGWELWAIEEWQKTSWIKYGMRVNISEEWIALSRSAIPEAWEYLYLKFWRSKYTNQLVYGPLHVRELPYEEWEKEFEIPSTKRFQVLHWGRKESRSDD